VYRSTFSVCWATWGWVWYLLGQDEKKKFNYKFSPGCVGTKSSQFYHSLKRNIGNFVKMFSVITEIIGSAKILQAFLKDYVQQSSIFLRSCYSGSSPSLEGKSLPWLFHKYDIRNWMSNTFMEGVFL